MDGKQLYKIWAPSRADVWTRFAKPALFAHVNEVVGLDLRITPLDVSFHLKQMDKTKTAIIVDLPGKSGVEHGLRLAKIGYRPIPLYNGIHETKIDQLVPIVDNQPIIEALVSGAEILRDLDISASATPAFLLDANRDKQLEKTEGQYDNRWCVDVEDLPKASYLISNHIRCVVLWTQNKMSEDLAPIIEAYQDAGIEVFTYIKGQFRTKGVTVITSKHLLSVKMKEIVRRFENARFTLLLVTILAFVNLFFQFFVHEAPFLWTTPSLPWLSYLWVSETIGDLFALLIPIIYLILYLSSQKKRHLMPVVFVFFGVDVLIFYVYALYYGLWAFTGGSFVYGLIVFLPPVFFITSLVRGVVAWKGLKGVSDVSYLSYLDQLDGRLTSSRGGSGGGGRHRSRYRGYRGYGGSGNGGYSGRGYGGGGYGGYGG